MSFILAANRDHDSFDEARKNWNASFLWNAGKRTFVSYEDPESLRRKCRYVRDGGLAGVMFWEYTVDSTGQLLETLFTELRGKAGAR